MQRKRLPGYGTKGGVAFNGSPAPKAGQRPLPCARFGEAFKAFQGGEREETPRAQRATGECGRSRRRKTRGSGKPGLYLKVPWRKVSPTGSRKRWRLLPGQRRDAAAGEWAGLPARIRRRGFRKWAWLGAARQDPLAAAVQPQSRPAPSWRWRTPKPRVSCGWRVPPEGRPPSSCPRTAKPWSSAGAP